jgi:ribonuclease T2
MRSARLKLGVLPRYAWKLPSVCGREISIGAIKDAFSSAFGTGAGDRIRLACKRDGSRLLITEITIGLGSRPDGATPLADLIKASSPTDPGCPGGTVDPAGYQ